MVGAPSSLDSAPLVLWNLPKERSLDPWILALASLCLFTKQFWDLKNKYGLCRSKGSEIRGRALSGGLVVGSAAVVWTPESGNHQACGLLSQVLSLFPDLRHASVMYENPSGICVFLVEERHGAWGRGGL